MRNAHANGLNVRVINVSFGLPSGSDGGLVAAALRRAWAAGIVVVTSAGNQGNSARSLDAPANDAKFLAVGALATEPMKVAPFSSGATGLGARRPDLIAPGVDIVGARVPGSLLDLTFPDARLGDHGFRGSGTSQATAVTSASVACLLQQRPGLNPDQVKLLLVGSAHALPWVSTNLQGRGVEQVDDAQRRETAVRLRRELGQPIHGAPARGGGCSGSCWLRSTCCSATSSAAGRIGPGTAGPGTAGRATAGREITGNDRFDDIVPDPSAHSERSTSTQLRSS
ncbi:MAG: S8 family serine peptidase [Ilumatobacteraceae bacterium]